MKKTASVIIFFIILAITGFNADPSPDETASLLSSLSNIKSNFLQGQHPPLFFSIAYLIRLAGGGLLSLRLFSLICMIITFLVMHRTLRVSGRNELWLLLLCNPGFVHFATEGTGYSLHIMLGILVFHSYLRLLKGGSRVPFVITTVLCAYSYYYHAFFIAGLLVWSIAAKKRIPYRSLLIIFVLVIPLVIAMLSNPFTQGLAYGSSNELSITKPALFEMSNCTVILYFVFAPAYLFTCAVRYGSISLIQGVILTPAIIYLVLRTRESRIQALPFFTTFLLLGLFSLITQTRIARYSFFPYHLLPYLPCLVLSIAKASLPRLEKNVFPTILCALILIFSLLYSSNIYPADARQELSYLLSTVEKYGFSDRDLIFANHIYEWKIVTFKDQIQQISTLSPVKCTEDFADYGETIFNGKKRIFELNLPYMDHFPYSNSDFSDDPLFSHLQNTIKIRDYLSKRFKQVKVVETPSRTYRLQIWESRIN